MNRLNSFELYKLYKKYQKLGHIVFSLCFLTFGSLFAFRYFVGPILNDSITQIILIMLYLLYPIYPALYYYNKANNYYWKAKNQIGSNDEEYW